MSEHTSNVAIGGVALGWIGVLVILMLGRSATLRPSTDAPRGQSGVDTAEAWRDGLTKEEVDLVTADVDYYSALGLASSASAAVAKVAYRAGLKEQHPDLTGNGSGDAVIGLTAAYKVIGNRRLRFAYDSVVSVRGSVWPRRVS